jgi:hypothetical protein
MRICWLARVRGVEWAESRNKDANYVFPMKYWTHRIDV